MNNNTLKNKRILEAIDYIDEDLIAEVTEDYEIFDQNTGAAMSSRAKRKFYAKLAAAAACLVLIAGLMSAAPTILQRLNAIIPGTSVAGTEQSEINSELLNDQTELDAVVSEEKEETAKEWNFFETSYPWSYLWYNYSITIVEIQDITDETFTLKFHDNTITFRKVKCRTLYSRMLDLETYNAIDNTEIYIDKTSAEQLMPEQIIMFNARMINTQKNFWGPEFDDIDTSDQWYSIYYPIIDDKVVLEYKGSDISANFESLLLSANDLIEVAWPNGYPQSDTEKLLPKKPLKTGCTIEEIIEFFDVLDEAANIVFPDAGIGIKVFKNYQ